MWCGASHWTRSSVFDTTSTQAVAGDDGFCGEGCSEIGEDMRAVPVPIVLTASTLA